MTHWNDLPHFIQGTSTATCSFHHDANAIFQHDNEDHIQPNSQQNSSTELFRSYPGLLWFWTHYNIYRMNYRWHETASARPDNLAQLAQTIQTKCGPPLYQTHYLESIGRLLTPMVGKQDKWCMPELYRTYITKKCHLQMCADHEHLATLH